MESIAALTEADLEALLFRAAHYTLMYQAGSKLQEAERAARHRQAHLDAKALEELAKMVGKQKQKKEGI